MPPPSDARQVRLFCFEHGRPTRDYAGATIFCDNDEKDGHLLARDFPFADDWEYCCDCECFYTLEQARKVRAAGGEGRCPACGREAIRHYLCADCKVISHKSGDKVVRAVYSITATGLVRPSCPGCLAVSAAAVQEHECHVLGLGFTTARAVCPFCKLVVSRESPAAAAAAQGVTRRGGEEVGGAPPAKAEPAPTPRREAAKSTKSDRGRSAPAARPASEEQPAKDAAPRSELPRKLKTTTPQEPADSEADEPRWPNARRNILWAVVTIVVALTAAAAGFYLFSKEEPTPRPPMSVAEAQKAVEAARAKLVPAERLESLRAASAEARSKADDLKAKWERFRGMTIQGGKNPEDPTQAPRTIEARREYEEAEAEARVRSQDYGNLRNRIEQTRQDLQAAEAALASARQRVEDEPVVAAPSEPAPESWMPFAWTTLLPTLLAALALGLAGILAIWSWKLTLESVETTGDVKRLYRQLKRLSSELDGQSQQLQKLSVYASRLREDASYRLERLQDDVAKVREELATLRRMSPAPHLAKSAPAGDDGAPPARAYRVSHAAAPAYEEVVDFPISAGTFLSRVSGQQQMPIKLDPLKGILVRDQEGLGLLMLVRDGSVYGGQLCMVPGMTLLNHAQEFHFHYERFYDCGRPSAGEVWISKPALVDKVDGGWRLLEKGVLEIKP
jgi:hypothetical protein